MLVADGTIVSCTAANLMLALFSILWVLQTGKNFRSRLTRDLEQGVLFILLGLWLADDCTHTLKPAYQVAVILHVKPGL